MQEHEAKTEGEGLRLSAAHGPSCYPRGRKGWLRLDDDGLTEMSWPGRRSIRWSDVRAVEWAHDHALIHSLLLHLRLDRRYGDWAAIAHEVEDRAGLRPEPATAVTPAQLAEWLGIPLDGQLVCRMRLNRVAIAGLLLAYVALMVVLGAKAPGSTGGMWQGLLIFGFMFACAETVRADVDGVIVRYRGKPQRFAWSDITGLRNDSYRWRIETTHGTFSLSGSLSHCKSLLDTLKRVVAAQHRGLRLPSAAPMPEGALSRPGEAEADERGLSRAGDEA